MGKWLKWQRTLLIVGIGLVTSCSTVPDRGISEPVLTYSGGSIDAEGSGNKWSVMGKLNWKF
jgi:hypothetical protein